MKEQLDLFGWGAFRHKKLQVGCGRWPYAVSLNLLGYWESASGKNPSDGVLQIHGSSPSIAYMLSVLNTDLYELPSRQWKWTQNIILFPGLCSILWTSDDTEDFPLTFCTSWFSLIKRLKGKYTHTFLVWASYDFDWISTENYQAWQWGSNWRQENITEV